MRPGGPRLRVAEIESVISADGHVVSVERLVTGRHLSEQHSGSKRVVTQATVYRLGEVLDALAQVPQDAVLSGLPILFGLLILPGEPPFGPGADFAASWTDLVGHRVAPVAEAFDDAMGGSLTSIVDQVRGGVVEPPGATHRPRPRRPHP